MWGVRKIPWRRETPPTPVFWPREFHAAYTPWGHKESDKIWWLINNTEASPFVRDNNSIYTTVCMFSGSYVSNSLQPCSPLRSSLCGIFQARILKWVAISSSRRSSWPRDWTHISCASCIGRRILYHWATREALFSYSVQFSSVAQSCLWDPMNHSMPSLPVHHQLLEFTQTHVCRVGDDIQPSHPLSSPSPPAPNPSQHQGLFQWVNSSHEVAKVLEFQL